MKYITPTIDMLIIGLKYEHFDTILKKNTFPEIEGLDKFSDEYFKELHSNDKYWERREWVEKTVDKNTVWKLPDSWLTVQYTPMNIKCMYRVKPTEVNIVVSQVLTNLKNKTK